MVVVENFHVKLNAGGVTYMPDRSTHARVEESHKKHFRALICARW